MKKKVLALFLVLVMALTGTGLGMPVALGAPEELDAYDQLRLKWYNMAVGGDYEENDPDLQPMLQSINDTAQDYWDRMNPSPVCNAVNGRYNGVEGAGDSSQDYLWEEYPLGWRGDSIDSNSIHFSYQYLRAMALAHETRGCELYHNEALLADIERGLEYLYINHFNESISNYGNWFGWGIGAPIYLDETLILLYDSLPWEDILKYAVVSRKWAENNMIGAANSLWQLRASMYAGMLLKDQMGNYKGSQMTGGQMLERVQQKVPDYLGYVTSGDGYYPDGTYIAHSNIAYNGGYGYTALSESCHLVYMLTDTPWEIMDEKSKNVFQWIYDSYETIIYNGVLMDAFRGREIARTDMKQADAAIIVVNAILMAIEMAEPEDAANYKSMIKQWYAGNTYTLKNLNESADLPWHKFPLDTVVRILNIVDDDTIQPRHITGKYYQFTQSDRAVLRGETFSACVAMASKRIAHYETGDVNTKGWNTGSGMTYIYNGDLERYDGLNKATIDWFRLPGTTSVYNKKVNTGTSSQSFAGGTGDGMYGVSGMQLAAPGTNLKAKKSWFMFDDEIVALGSDIQSSGDSESTETTFENYMIDDAGDNRLVVDGEEQPSELGWEEKKSDVQWLNIEANVEGANLGIYFPEKETVSMKRETRSGRWTDLGGYNTDATLYSANYLTLWKDHGVNPINETYSYILLPNKTANETADYAGNSDVTILRNDALVQAAYEKNLNLVGANFWEGASIDAKGIGSYLTSDSPSSVMVRENDREMEISVSDPTQENKGSIQIELNRAARGVISADEGVEVLSTTPTIRLKVHVNNAKGKTFSTKLSFEDLGEPESTAIEGFKTEGDEVVVTLAPAARAKAYTLRYGTESGKYPYTQSSTGTSIRLNGLTAGETYYFTAVAFNDSGESPQAPEQSFTVPLTTQFTDHFDTMDQILSRSSNILLEVSDGANFSGDTSTLKRATMEEGWITYSLPALSNFTLVSYIHSTAPGTVTLFTSPDNEVWTELQTKDQTSGSSWVRHTITPLGKIPEGTNYLKIVLNGTTKAWSPQLSDLTATIAYGVKERQMVDSMVDFSKIYRADHVVLHNGAIEAQDQNTGSLVYSLTQMQEMVVQASGNVSLAVSEDGLSYTALDDLEITDRAIHAELNGAKYVQIMLNGDAKVSGVQIDYLHEIAPIEAIRFDEDTFRAVALYDVEPSIKKAPMNGTGELLYETSNEAIATYENGILHPKAVGSTDLTASVLGSDITAEATVDVYHNVAKNKTATSSAYYNGYAPDKAFDGNMNDAARWQSSGSGISWIQVDLGEIAEIEWMDFTWDSIGGDYAVTFSEDGDTWSKPITMKEADGKQVAVETPGIKARYVKLTGLAENAVYGLVEWRLLNSSHAGSDEDVVDTNIALNQEILCSNENIEGGYAAKNAVDGDLNTRWDVDKSHRDDNQWIAVNLGEPSTVTAVNLNFEAAYAKEYTIQISDDGKKWTDLLTNKAGAVGWNYHNLESPVQAQYVKMQCIKRGTNYGVSLFEFEVIGRNQASMEPVELTSITMLQDSVKLLPGHTQTLNVLTEPVANAASLQWSSSDEAIATVNANGLVTAHKEGTVRITACATLNPKVQAVCTVTVVPYSGLPVSVASVEIQNAPEEPMTVGTSQALQVVVLPENASNRNVQWISSDSSVAKVNSRGIVTAVAEGTATITAKSVVSDCEDQVEIAVVPKEAPSAHVLVVQYGNQATMEFNGNVEQEILDQDGLYAASVLGGTELTLTFIPKGEECTFRTVTLNGKPVEGVTPDGLTFAYTMKNSSANLTFVFETVNKSVLKTILEVAEGLVNSEEWEAAVPSVQKAFDKALAEARSVYYDKDASQEQVNQTWSNLLDAIHHLSFAKGDKSRLEQLVSIAEELEPTDFIEESYNVMAQVLEDAKKILQDEDALEKEVQDTYDTLYEAMVSLERVAEKNTLNSAIAKAVEIETNLNLYMTDGKEAFKRALAAAKRVAVDSNVSQEKVDRATEALTEAMAALRKLADKTQLEELLHRANTINLSGYTSSSVSQFKAACNVLEALVSQKEVAEEEAQAAIKAYLIAEGNLKPVNSPSPSKKGSSSKNAAANTYADAGRVQVAPKNSIGSAVRSVLCDTTIPFTVKHGSAYCFKITVLNGSPETPSFTVGNGNVLKTQFVAKRGNDYYYRVWAIGMPGESAGVYTQMPNETPQRQCVVTIV